MRLGCVGFRGGFNPESHFENLDPKNLSNKNEVSGCYPRIYLRKTYFFAWPPLVIAVHPVVSL